MPLDFASLSMSGMGLDGTNTKWRHTMMTMTFTTATGSVTFEYPERISHRVLGEDYDIDLSRVTEEGWRALLAKSRRFIADGSPDVETVLRKIEQLYGEGKPIGQRTTRDPVAGAFASIVTKKFVARGLKVKEVPKLGSTVEGIRDVALECGIPATLLKKAEKRAREIAALEVADID